MINSSSSRPDSFRGTEQEYQEARAAALELEWRSCGESGIRPEGIALHEGPWKFIATYLLTEDSQDSDDPYKPFPERCHEYLQCTLWYVMTEPMLAIEKSRQVMVTWLLAAYSLWLCMFRKGSYVRIQSITKEDAEAVIDRIAVMYRSLPDWMRQRCPAKIIGRRIKFLATRSRIVSVPQGAAHHRGATPTLVWSDETAAQIELKEIWKALKPSLNAGKGRVIFTSTQAPGWFRMLTTDKLSIGVPQPPIYHHEICHGLTARKLAKNRFVVLRLHYSADPEKRKEAWVELAKAGYSEADWQQEMEINPDAHSGVPALPGFTAHRDKILCNPFNVPAHWPRYLSVDYGANRSPTSAHAHAVDERGDSWTYWEFYKVGPWGVFLEVLKEHPDFGRWLVKILDQSCFAQTQQSSVTLNGQTTHSVRSVAELAEDVGVYFTPAAKVDDKTKIAMFDHVWPDAEDAQKRPTFHIFRTCVSLIRELPGIVWAEYSEAQQREKNVKVKLVDKDNHAFDDVSYWLLFRYADAVDNASHAELTGEDAANEQARQYRLEDRERTMRLIEERQMGFDVDEYGD